MADWYLYTLSVEDSITGEGAPVRERLEASMDAAGDVVYSFIHQSGKFETYTLTVDDQFMTNGWYELRGMSRYDSAAHIVGHLRNLFPRATIEGTITQEEQL